MSEENLQPKKSGKGCLIFLGLLGLMFIALIVFLLITKVPDSESPKSLLPDAGEVCEQAFRLDTDQLTVREDGEELTDTNNYIPEQPLNVEPVYGIIKINYLDDPIWESASDHDIDISLIKEARYATEVKSLVCIKQSRTYQQYSDGSKGYTIHLNIRLVSWPDGVLLGPEISMSGSPPPSKKTGSGDRVGGTPESIGIYFIKDNILPLESIKTFTVGESVYSAAFSPVDEDKILAIATDNEIQVYASDSEMYDAYGWKRQFSLREHTDAVQTIAISPDGSLLASASRDHQVLLWDLATGQLISSFKDQEGSVYSVSFSHDSRLLASVGPEVIVWDLDTGEGIFTYPVSISDCDVAFSPTAQTLAISKLGNPQILLFNLETGQQVGSIKGPRGIESIAYSPSGEIIALGGLHGDIILWDLVSEGAIYTLRNNSDSILSVAFSPDGRTLASGSADKTATLWDVATGKQIAVMREHEGDVNSVAFSPDSKVLVTTGDSDDTAKLWFVARKPLE